MKNIMKNYLLLCFIFSVVTSASVLPKLNNSDDDEPTQLQKCFQENQIFFEEAQKESCHCLTNYFTTQKETALDNDTETILKHIFRKTCMDSEQVTTCLAPLQSVLESCFENSSILERKKEKVLNATFAHICQDEGQSLAEMVTDPKEVECIQNFPDIVNSGECEIEDNKVWFSLATQCEKAKRFVQCFANAFRRRCDTHKLVNYLEKLMGAILDANSCKQHCNCNKTVTSLPTTTSAPLLTTKRPILKGSPNCLPCQQKKRLESLPENDKT